MIAVKIKDSAYWTSVKSCIKVPQAHSQNVYTIYVRVLVQIIVVVKNGIDFPLHVRDPIRRLDVTYLSFWYCLGQSVSIPIL